MKAKGSSSAATAGSRRQPVGFLLSKVGRSAGCGQHALLWRRKIAKAKAPRQKRRRGPLVRETAPIRVRGGGGRDGNRLRTVSRAETGRLGEAAVHQYLVKQLGPNNVIWMNESTEFGLPYDIVIRNGGVTRYIEVKATVFPDKYWFHISRNEWRFASKKGEAFIIAYVLLSSGRDKASIALLKNPQKLCRRGDLKLAVVVSDEFEETVSRQLKQIAVVLKPGHN